MALIEHCAGTGRVCGLTFDDGPNGPVTSRLLDFLGEHDIRAVFCVIGREVLEPGGAELLRRMAAEGHVIANHSTKHSDLGDWSRAAIRDDLSETTAIIRNAIGDDSFPIPYFRAPFGHWGRAESVAEELGMRSLAVINTIDDWRTQDLPTLIENLRAAMKSGQLVLAHDGGADRERTVDAVITVVTERLADGWRFTLPAVDNLHHLRKR